MFFKKLTLLFNINAVVLSKVFNLDGVIGNERLKI